MKRIEGVTERLLAAAREEFLEKGYEAASLRAIAERAGSSKGAIYVRYADKEALYAAVVDPVIEELCLFFRAGWQAIFDPQFAALVDLAAQMPDAPVQDVAARLVEARGGAP